MGMRYFRKWVEDEERFQYEERNHDVSDDLMEEISEEEYTIETKRQWGEYLDSLPEEISTEPTYEELLAENAELEKENAALLFQILTGEEYAEI